MRTRGGQDGGDSGVLITCGDVEEKVPHAQSEHDRDEEFRLVSHRDEHQQVAERALQREDQSEDA